MNQEIVSNSLFIISTAAFVYIIYLAIRMYLKFRKIEFRFDLPEMVDKVTYAAATLGKPKIFAKEWKMPEGESIEWLDKPKGIGHYIMQDGSRILKPGHLIAVKKGKNLIAILRVQSTTPLRLMASYRIILFYAKTLTFSVEECKKIIQPKIRKRPIY